MADQSAQSVNRSDMAILLLGYFEGVMYRKETRSHFKIKKIDHGPSTKESPPEYFDVKFVSGTRVRVRVSDAP